MRTYESCLSCAMGNRLVGPSSDGTPGDTRVRLREAGLVSAGFNVDSR